MYYGNKSVKELDVYYGIGLTGKPNYPWWMHEQCEKIQQSFINHAIILTLMECKELYETWSDMAYCASWENGLDEMTHEEIFKLLLPWLKDMMNDKIDRLTTIEGQLEQNGYMK